MNRFQTKKENQKGFMLVELMVALTLFTLVIMAAISSLYSVNDAARKVEAMRSVLDNLNFAIESMSRTIRTGTNVGCRAISEVDCPFGDFSPGEELVVDGTLGGDGKVEYQLWLTPEGTGQIQKQVDDGNWVSLTAPGIDVQRLSFFVNGADPGDTEQPSVIMLVQGVATAGEDTAPFAIQTQVSLRTAE